MACVTGELADIAAAQTAVYGRTYTATQVTMLPEKERTAYDKKQSKFLKKFTALQAARSD